MGKSSNGASAAAISAVLLTASEHDVIISAAPECSCLSFYLPSGV
jgi:hypothetical protein